MPLGLFNQVKRFEIESPDSRGEGNQEAPVGVPGIPLVVAREGLGDGLCHAYKNHRCQHPRHGKYRATTHGKQQRGIGVAEMQGCSFIAFDVALK